MRLFFIIIIIDFFCIIYSDPDVKHFYIESNKIKCALLDISSDIHVFYPTGHGYNYINLNMSQSQPDQSGLCDNVTKAQFTISIPPTETLSFNFKNTNQSVILTSIQFTYQLPNVNFPDSVQPAGIFTNISYTNFTLSNSNSFYQCNSKMQFNISNDILLNIYKVKVKVYNVVNNSFGNENQECPQDFQNKSTTYIPETSTYNSKTTSYIHPTSKSTHNTDFTTSFQNKSTTYKSSTHNSKTTSNIHSSTHYTDFTSSLSTTSTPTSPYQTSKNSDKSSESPTTRHSTPTSYSPSTSPTVKTTTFDSDKNLFYIVDSRTANVCLVLRTNLTIEITYENSKNKNSTKTFADITNDNFSGYCNSIENVLDIKWISGISFRMNFTSDQTYSTLSTLSLNYTISNSSFPDCLHPGKISIATNSIDDNCKTQNKNGYTCSILTYKFGSAKVTLNNFKYEAFRESKSTTFSNNEIDCNNKSYIIPIIVGVALAIFLVIVVIIFLILRCRNKRNSSYETI